MGRACAVPGDRRWWQRSEERRPPAGAAIGDDLAKLRKHGGGDAGAGHATPPCCTALREVADAFQAELVHSPPKGNGASLAFRVAIGSPGRRMLSLEFALSPESLGVGPFMASFFQYFDQKNSQV